MNKSAKSTPILKFKSLIYKYTGLYLAETEENIYIQSDEFWKEWSKIIKNRKNDMSPRNVQGLLIGMWQAHHGFVRSYSRLSWKRPRFFWSFVGWFDILFKTIKWDLQSLVRKFRR